MRGTSSRPTRIGRSPSARRAGLAVGPVGHYREAMHVVTLSFDLHIAHAQSLKDKRQVLRSLIDGLRHRFSVSVAEVDFQNLWQRSRVGVALIGSDPTVLAEVGDDIDRWVWSFPEVTVTHSARSWFDPES